MATSRTEAAQNLFHAMALSHLTEESSWAERRGITWTDLRKSEEVNSGTGGTGRRLGPLLIRAGDVLTGSHPIGRLFGRQHARSAFRF